MLKFPSVKNILSKKVNEISKDNRLIELILVTGSVPECELFTPMLLFQPVLARKIDIKMMMKLHKTFTHFFKTKVKIQVFDTL